MVFRRETVYNQEAVSIVAIFAGYLNEVYIKEMFLRRNKVLCEECEERKVRIEEREETCHNNMEFTEAQELFFPTTVHLLDCYDMMTVEERNRLWKLMIKRITYYRNLQHPDEIEIHLYPKLGRAISA